MSVLRADRPKGDRIMQLSPRVRVHIWDIISFLKWVLYAGNMGIIAGLVAVAFHRGIDIATELRALYPWIIWFLPLGGMAIVLLYRICGMEKDLGTNLVLVAVRDAEPMRLRTAPLIFISTILTHLVGGSAGREGAALQLGGSLSAWIGRKIRLDAKDSRLMVMCGMAAAFSGLFGTPLTAAVFAMEVVSVGVMYYAAIVPCLVSSLVALLVARSFGMHLTQAYTVTQFMDLSPLSMVQVTVLGVLCAVLSIWFCKLTHAAPHLYQRLFPNPVPRAAVGGALVLLLTLLVGDQSYNGAGDVLIRSTLAGEIRPEAFLLKMLFTALTLGAGFRGGEIVPVLCVGCTFGAAVSPLLSIPASFAGALGMTATFCGATNCPMTALLLSYELFGGQSLPLYGLCIGVSYMLSGYYGLYSEQKIVYSKFKTEWIDTKAK